MGITGLLPALKSIQKPEHVKKWAGQKVAVDGYGWLHRGTVACALEIALDKPTTKHVDFALNRVRMLLHYGVIPYMVFDGDYLPSKAGEELERARRRETSKKAGLDLLRQGKTSQAYSEFQKAVDITPKMARQLIDACKTLGVQCLVAPYEADAQLYYLEKNGIVSAIISEDSDLLVFGCKTLITKLDQYGECIEICKDDFAACKELSLASWTDREFRCMAILSGCDYLENIPRLGLKTAYRFVRKYKTIEKIIKALRFDGGYAIPENYLEAFRQADLTYLHQRVFCPVANKLVMCTEPENPLRNEELIFIGPEIEEDIARRVASGELDPMTKDRIVVGQVLHLAKFSPRPKITPKQAVSPKPAERITSFFTRTPLREALVNQSVSRSSPSKVLDDVHQKRVSPSESLSTTSKRIKYDIFAEEKENCGQESSRYFRTPKSTQGCTLISPPEPSVKDLTPISTRNFSSFAFLPTTPRKTTVSTRSPSPHKNRSPPMDDSGDSCPMAGNLTTRSPASSTPNLPPKPQSASNCVHSRVPSSSGYTQATMPQSPENIIPDTPPKLLQERSNCVQVVPESPLQLEKRDDDSVKLVIEGWRQHYSFQPTTFASKFTPSISVPKQARSSIHPRQAGRGKSTTLRRRNTGSIRQVPRASSNSSLSEENNAKTVGISLEKFRHTAS